jgi:hypothetical protein
MKIVAGVLLALVVIAFFFYHEFYPAKEIIWGLNFSILQAKFLGQDWKKLYHEILNDFHPQRLRIMVYWQSLEPKRGVFDFEDIDYLLSEASKYQAKVILVLGHKQPRWPECHHPEWYDSLTPREQEQATLKMLEEAVDHFRISRAVYAWQIENEPFFQYGPDCPSIDRDFYRREIAEVRALDSRPIIVTDSGEKGAWLPVSLAGGQILGSTMYREVYHNEKKKYVKYYIPPALYRIKAGIVKFFSPIKEFIGVELQAEPWFATDVFQTDWSRQQELMNPEILTANLDYARRVGFAENYLWGVEWWYWAKAQGHPEMWETARQILNPSE